MYQNEKFKQVGTLGEGAVVMKLPGTDVKMSYSAGTAFVNAQGNVGLVSLNLTDLVAEKVGEAEGLIGGLGEQLAEQLSDPETKQAIREIFAKDKLHLAYSQTKDGKEVLTIPGMSGETSVDDEHLEGKVVAVYSTIGQLPSKEEVYALHSRAVSERELVNDKKALTESTLKLVEKANCTYEAILRVIEASGF